MGLLVPCLTVLVACSSDSADPPHSGPAAPPADTGTPGPATPPATTPDGQEDLKSLVWNPHFEPDFNNLTAQPWVEPVTKSQQDTVVVRPDELEFLAAVNPEVRDWAVGRVVVSAPGEGAGKNPFGFARRVVSVRDEGDKIIVTTESVGLEDLVAGDFQSTYDPSQSSEVDLSKLDLEWAAANLYTSSPYVYMPGEPLLDDYPVDELQGMPGNPFFGKLFSAVAGAAKAVASVAQNVYSAITPASFNGSISMSPEISGGGSFDLFRNMNYKKQLRGGRYPVELYIKGSADVTASALVNPGFQVGATIPNVLHKNAGRFASWVNVDARAEAKVGLNFDLEAGISSAGGKAGSALEESLQKDADLAQDALTRARSSLFGDPDMKPAGGWRRPIWISKPSTRVLMAGPVPVVLVSTVQVDVECGFEAKASITGKVAFEQAYTFKFAARYERGSDPKLSGPTFDKRSRRDVQVLGSGSLAVTCGLIPRINTMLYDTAGINVGMRASLVARASYESKCAETTTTPKGEVSVGLYGNLGLQLGARVQAPGSSYAGKAGQSAGFDIGPIEPWNTQFSIYEKTWDLARGPGYCTPLCKNGTRDAAETDVDCGGGACQTCAAEKKCKVNSDCNSGTSCSGGKCKATPCSDGVISGSETDIDCGGSCATKCAAGKGCLAAADCASGFCKRNASAGQGVCVANHCGDGIRNSDESGTDCGGSTCAPCKTGTLSAVAKDCESGFSDGTYCVASSCQDRQVSPGESDVDCGGDSSCIRCGVGQTCTAHSDCSRGPYALLCVAGKCARPLSVGCDDGAWTGNETDVDCGGSCGATCESGKACKSGADCISDTCLAGTCVECESGAQCASKVCSPSHTCSAPTCSDATQNGDETDTDCGGSCATKCRAGQQCVVAADCASGECEAGLCKAPPAKDILVFLSSASYNGNLGGLAGADAKCQALASAASLPGTYKAFLSDSTTTASSRLSRPGGAYKLVNGTVVAKDAAAFFSSTHASAIVVDENGGTSGGEVWTGSGSNGIGSGGCSNWTSTSGTAQIGASWQSTSQWASLYQQFCDRTNVHLYCIQQ
ncbi:Tryptophan synthase alpha chain [Labilithrix luteola]|uniref:Tryptophan synthase alpha chain n=2 Tax=Labilithrix luteola TaxID=1391654 RepID=A0A0K1PPT5_9BACT|nr:Tryptophan synthase alpha chain [Labilithrix luteola]